MVTDYFPDMNCADQIDYKSEAWTISGTQDIARSYFKFNMSAPPGSVVQSAYLSLYYAPVNSEGGAQHSSLTNSDESVLQRVTSAWSETGITWNNQPSVITADEVILPQSIIDTQDYTNIDVTAMVQQMTSTGNNYGFMLKLANETHYARLIFASGDNPDSSKFPRLDICYSIPDHISETDQSNDLLIYPDPASEGFTISFEKVLQNATLKIFNVLGEQVYLKTINGKQEAINNKLSSGVYFVLVLEDNRKYMQKLVVQ